MHLEKLKCNYWKAFYLALSLVLCVTQLEWKLRMPIPGAECSRGQGMCFCGI